MNAESLQDSLSSSSEEARQSSDSDEVRESSSDIGSSLADDDETEDGSESSGELVRMVETKVRDTEKTLTGKVDDSVWQGRGPLRIKTWTTSAQFFSQPLLVNQFHLTPLVNQWWKDVVVIPHNAVKMEIIDMYKMIRSFEVFRRKIQSSDLARFFTWFELTEKFIKSFLELDEELIMKPVDGVTTLPSILHVDSRREEKQAVDDAFTIINTYRVQAEVLKENDETFKSFIQSCRILASRLVNYISTKEKYVPNQIYRYSNEEETMAMQNTMVTRLKTQKNDGEKLYVLFMRDLDVKSVREWNKRYLRWMQRKFWFRKWRRQLRVQHFKLVDQIWRDVGDPGGTYLPGTWGSSRIDIHNRAQR